MWEVFKAFISMLCDFAVKAFRNGEFLHTRAPYKGDNQALFIAVYIKTR